jgi:hypothetical protein
VSDTATLVGARIRSRLNATNISSPALDEEPLFAAINDSLIELAHDGIVGKTWTDSFVTLVAADYDYTLSTTSSAEYESVWAVRRHSDGLILNKRTPARLEEMYNRQSASRGRPTDYALFEDTSQGVSIRVGPTPDGSTESLDIMFEKIPGRISIGTDTIGLSRAGLGALECLACAKLFERLSPALLDQLDLGVNAGASFLREAEKLKAAERQRLHSMSSADDIQLLER